MAKPPESRRRQSTAASKSVSQEPDVPVRWDIATLRNAILRGSKNDVDPEKQVALQKAEKEAAEIAGRRSFFELRKKWSWWIVTWISALIAFNVFLTISVGFGWQNFEHYQWFITLVTVETFLQIVGMGYIAVNYLFSEKK